MGSTGVKGSSEGRSVHLWSVQEDSSIFELRITLVGASNVSLQGRGIGKEGVGTGRVSLGLSKKEGGNAHVMILQSSCTFVG